MLGPSCSGFGWNDNLKCIGVEQHIFDEWVKVKYYIWLTYLFFSLFIDFFVCVDNDMNFNLFSLILVQKDWETSHFSYYDDLAFIFPKDRVNGANIEGPMDMAGATLEREMEEEDSHDFDDFYIPYLSVGGDDVNAAMSDTPTNRSVASGSKGKNIDGFWSGC